MERKKILWLCSWYPNRNDPFDGDFVQRHARAAATYNDIHVITLKSAASDEEVIHDSPGLTEQIFYFRKKGGFSKPMDVLHWFSSYKKIISNYIQSNGKPALVHLHVPWNAGLLALWVKWKYNIPFVVTEHWGIYNEYVQPPYSKRPFFFRLLIRSIMKNAAHLASVSTHIAEGIGRYTAKLPFTVIRNVVDTSLFFYNEHKSEVFTFIHVSNLAPVKNIEGILKAMVLLEKNITSPFKLVIAGNRDNTYVEMAREMKLLNRIVFFRGEISYAEVAQEMQKADCLVLNSISENAPCVIGEALCVGLPVVTTMAGGIPEMVDERNSIPVHSNDPNALHEALKKMIECYKNFNRETIAADASGIYDNDVIGKNIHNLYKRLTFN